MSSDSCCHLSCGTSSGDHTALLPDTYVSTSGPIPNWRGEAERGLSQINKSYYCTSSAPMNLQNKIISNAFFAIVLNVQFFQKRCPNIGMRSLQNMLPPLLNFQTLERLGFLFFLVFLFFLGKKRLGILENKMLDKNGF